MKTVIIIILLLVMGMGVKAADKYISKTGHIWFYGKTPLETIEADNNQVATIIDTKNNIIAFDLLQKSFKFERALMEEHYNENYMESDKYPKGAFKGKFVDFDPANFSKDGTYNVIVEGDLKMHGVTNHIKEKGTLEVKDGVIYAKSTFNVKPEDYGIEIPGLVRDKIAKTMQVNVDITYKPFNK